MADLRDYMDRLERATSKSEILEILKDLRREFDEDDPKVLELVKKYTR